MSSKSTSKNPVNDLSMDMADFMWRKLKPLKNIQDRNKAIRAMAFIQNISKTKPVGWVTSMKDLKDRSAVLEELLALMHHFKGNELSDDDWLQFPDRGLPKTIIILRGSGSTIFPYINDPNYFMTRAKKRQTDKEAKKMTNENQTKPFQPTEKKSLDLEGNPSQLILEPYQIQEMGSLFIQLDDLGLLKRMA